MAARVLRPLATGLAMVLLMTVALGLLYPVAMTGVLQGLFPAKADGSLVRVDGTVVGSDLAGQVFTSPAYFHSRPSATTPPYDPSATTSAVDANIAAALRLERPYDPGLTAADLPVDMVTTSGSGVDPDISPANALLQSRRVAAVRALARDRVVQLIHADTTGRSLGFLGQPRVNVLRLNIDLDRLAGPPGAAR
jgi:K+-transporting ATPase ATPase C chain